MTTTEVIARLLAKDDDGRWVSVEFGIGGYAGVDEAYLQIFADAHCRADGDPPSPIDVAMDPSRYAAAMALRKAELELKEKLKP